MKKYLVLILLVAVLVLPAFAQEGGGDSASEVKGGYTSDPGFNGPGSTTAQLEEDDAANDPAFEFPRIDHVLQPWFDWKHRLNEQFGLEIGIAYTGLYQWASDVPEGSEDSAGSGILRLSGRWELLNHDSANTGALVISVDHRHAYTDIAPADLGFQGGYYGISGTLFSDLDLALGDLNWQQSFNNGQTGLIVGRYDPNDYFDVLGYANPWTTFQNLSILFNASIALPNFSTGIGIGHWFNDRWYAKAAVNDVNVVAADTKLFEDWGELYTTAEVGWSPSREERYLKNIHVTYWHADEREDDGIEESEGIAIGANWTWNERWMLFSKMGWSDGTSPLYSASVTAGMMYRFQSRSDLMGVGVNWGDPSDDTLEEQVTAEAFYRFQFSRNFAITPSVQYVSDPALNPEEDDMWLGSIRARFTF